MSGLFFVSRGDAMWQYDDMATIEEKLRERERRLIASCEAANADAETTEIEREMDALNADGLEGFAWHDTNE